MSDDIIHDIREVAEKLFSENKMTHALVYFEKFSSENPNDPVILMKLGICQFRTEDFIAAEQSFQKVVQLQIRNHTAWYYLGLSQERRNNSSDAQTAYQFALSLQPDFKEAQHKLAITPEKPKQEKTASASPSGLEDTGMTKGLFTQQKSTLVFWVERLFHIFIGLVIYGGVFGGIAATIAGFITGGEEAVMIVAGLCVGTLVGVCIAIIGAGKVSRVI